MTDSTTSLPAIAGRPVLRYLETVAPPPRSVTALVEAGATRLLDSDMIITQPAAPPPAVRLGEGAFSPLHHAETEKAEAILATIEADGLYDYFKPLMGSFVRIMFGLLFSPAQFERACVSIDSGHQFTFLSSDAGGPALAGWRTIAHAEPGGIRLAVDKVWGMEAQRECMAVVAARLPSVMFPATYVVWPEHYRTLRREAYGEPFLEGRLQLGNVKGEVLLSRDDRLKLSGPTAYSKYLTTVRPFFVRGLMAHLAWLMRRDRLALDAPSAAAHAYITEAARIQSRSERYDFDNVQRVLAIKYASNELLVDLVRRGAVRDLSDQRDLLAFSKMEGSSYHCYHALRTSLRNKP
ncbi:MAG TPA: hypothetical protein VFP84_11905 [Kofleriaceae bacterium]|nr:hypothetical protein [Kofleriaceae bacterium]